MKFSIRCFFICFMLIPVLVLGQTPKKAVARLDTGILQGAAYEIHIPANWNKKLLMYAHGYEMPNPGPRKVYPNPLMQVFTEKGFAVAQSAYRQAGWALPEGVEDTEKLRQYFVNKYGKPDSTFIMGHSMGGGITVATLERYPQVYQGALALCPLSARPYEQLKQAFDSYVVFNALFPGHLPPMWQVLSADAAPFFKGDGAARYGQAAAIVQQIQATQADEVDAFLRYTGLKSSDLIGNLLAMDGFVRDLVAQSGGNPFDNTNTYYSGFQNDWALNQKVERLSATATKNRLRTYDRTGIIEKPLILMHTTYDQIISPTFGLVRYDELVHTQRKEKNLKVMYTDGQGHCNFTGEEIMFAFDALRQWAKSGKKPAAMAVPTAVNPVPKDSQCYELRIYTATPGNFYALMKRFRNHTTALFEKHGMTNIGYWTPLDNKDNKLYYVLAYPNRAARERAWKGFMADSVWQRVWKDSEQNGGLVANIESVFLETTDFSPNDLRSSPGSGVWELRIYHPATPESLELLLERFRSFTVKRFDYYGMNNKIYWSSTDTGQGGDKKLYYFLTHPSESAAKAAFDKFRKDPDWVRVRTASEEKNGGSLTNKIESVFLYPADFSRLK